MIKSYVCDHCGLCCQHLIVEADALDVLREPRIEAQRPLGRRSAALSLLEACWIVAAPGQPCPFLTARCRCRIYPTRPSNCVAFLAGSAQCQQLRKDHGLPALLPRRAAGTIPVQIQVASLQAESTDSSSPQFSLA